MDVGDELQEHILRRQWNKYLIIDYRTSRSDEIQDIEIIYSLSDHRRTTCKQILVFGISCKRSAIVKWRNSETTETHARTQVRWTRYGLRTTKRQPTGVWGQRHWNEYRRIGSRCSGLRRTGDHKERKNHCCYHLLHARGPFSTTVPVTSHLGRTASTPPCRHYANTVRRVHHDTALM